MKPSDLIKWRKAQGYTQQKIADILGVAKNTVYRWEAGLREIPSFLHLTLKCVEKKEGGEVKVKGTKRKGGKR